MAYTPTTWVNDSQPAISAENLNNIESGISALDTLAGSTDISAIGDGTVTGAISTLNSSLTSILEKTKNGLINANTSATITVNAPAIVVTSRANYTASASLCLVNWDGVTVAISSQDISYSYYSDNISSGTLTITNNGGVTVQYYVV